jgi:hypothetical protein
VALNGNVNTSHWKSSCSPFLVFEGKVPRRTAGRVSVGVISAS